MSETGRVMRILQICSARDIGGGERHVADLANSLAQRGHAVYAAVNPNAPLIGELPSLPKNNIFELRMRGAADVVAAENIAAIVRENKMDIIHAHVARDYPLAALASARSGGTPFVLTRHVLFPLSKVHKLLLGQASRVIAVSNPVAETIKKQRIFALDKIVTIHNGIDTSRYARDKNNAYPRGLPLIVGMIGHIAPIKGGDDFVRAAAILARERDDVNFSIVGEDKSPSGENRAALESLIGQLGMANRVRLAGWQDNVALLLRGFDVFVSPSRSEPFGLVILEAMAAGVPVVATASEGALEIIDDGVTGLIVPIDDVDALAAAISRLLDDPSLRERLAENALEHVNKRFSLKGMVDATEKVYDEILK